MKLKVLLIANPKASSYKKRTIVDAAKMFEADGYSVEVFTTGKMGDATQRARNAVTEGISFIVVAGGDGTINEVINAIANTSVKLAMLPIGGENVLAKECGLSGGVCKAVDSILQGVEHNVSLGRVKGDDGNTRYFTMMAGIGFDASVVFNVNNKIKRISGRLAYFISGIYSLLRYNPDFLDIQVADKAYNGYFVVVANGSKYGGDVVIAPDAKINDGKLNVIIFQKNRAVDVLKYIFGIIMQKHLGFVDVMSVMCGETSKIIIKGDAHIQVDGEYFGKTPCEIDIIPNALKVVCKKQII